MSHVTLRHMKNDEKYIPETLIECFRVIESEISPQDLEKFKNVRNSKFHPMDHNLGWGLYLRNRFIHPHHSPIRQKFKDLGILFEPDSISGFIRELFWMYLNGQEIEGSIFEELVKEELILLPVYEKNQDGGLIISEKEPEWDNTKLAALLG